MENEEYFETVYRIREKIQELDDAFDWNTYDIPVCRAEYDEAREKLQKELEAAFNM